MSYCKIIKHFPNANNWNTGDIVDITDPIVLIEQGLVELVVEEQSKPEEVEVVKVDEPKKVKKAKVEKVVKQPKRSIKDLFKRK